MPKYPAPFLRPELNNSIPFPPSSRAIPENCAKYPIVSLTTPFTSLKAANTGVIVGAKETKPDATAPAPTAYFIQDLAPSSNAPSLSASAKLMKLSNAWSI